MILFNIGLILIVFLVLSLVLGAITASAADKSEGFGTTLRRGIVTLLLIGLIGVVALAFSNDPTILQQVLHFFENLLTF